MKPEIGEFYYHKKHTDESINNYAYEIIGLAFHTETEEATVVYQPLYEENSATEQGLDFFVRPLEMFTPERFHKITDETIIAELREIKSKLFGDK